MQNNKTLHLKLDCAKQQDSSFEIR